MSTRRAKKLAVEGDMPTDHQELIFCFLVPMMHPFGLVF